MTLLCDVHVRSSELKIDGLHGVAVDVAELQINNFHRIAVNTVNH